jgi:hypothetical protein
MQSKLTQIFDDLSKKATLEEFSYRDSLPHTLGLTKWEKVSLIGVVASALLCVLCAFVLRRLINDASYWIFIASFAVGVSFLLAYTISISINAFKDYNESDQRMIKNLANKSGKDGNIIANPMCRF